MKKSASKTLVNYDEAFAKLARAAQSLEDTAATGGNRISLRAGVMAYAGQPITGNKLTCVVLDHIVENVWYSAKFVDGESASPDCFALAHDNAHTMRPHESAPNPQSETCAKCPKNAFGSADTGKGKACGNKRRLVLITEGSLKDIASAEVATLSIPVTSCKNWNGYVGQLSAALSKPPLAVVTEISVRPDPKSQFVVEFKMKNQVDKQHFEALLAKREAAQALLMRPYERVEQVVQSHSKKKAGAKARR